MNFCRRALKSVWRICTTVILCAAAGASAQTAYQQADAAGSTSITDRSDTTASPAAATVPAPEVAKVPLRNSKISARRAALIEANEAARRLAQARLARERGAEPLRGERARGSDASVVNHRYWRRQEKLRHEVEQALRRSNETGRSLHASR